MGQWLGSMTSNLCSESVDFILRPEATARVLPISNGQ